METQYGFTKMTLAEFKDYLNDLKVARTVLRVQQHHTYSPSYLQFKGTNHFSIQRGMKNYHVNSNGWSDIGQHFSTFPDGTYFSAAFSALSWAAFVLRLMLQVPYPLMGHVGR